MPLITIKTWPLSWIRFPAVVHNIGQDLRRILWARHAISRFQVAY